MDDQVYFSRRAADEWAAVGSATGDEARVAHATLAICYVGLLDGVSNVVHMRQPAKPRWDLAPSEWFMNASHRR
jgi:hypothetical protein